MKMHLPYPVSANRYWRHFRGMTVRSAEATKYISQVKALALVMRAKPFESSVKVELLITFHPKRTKKGEPSQIRQDLSNTIKVAEDALQGVLYVNDRQVSRIVADVGQAIEEGGLTVEVKEIEKSEVKK